jgi:hypothetical protein
MDSTALQELIAQVRGAKTALAETEQKVAATKPRFYAADARTRTVE